MNNPTQKFYAMEHTGNNETTIYLYDEVGNWCAGSKEFLADLTRLKGQHIHLRINSPGGSVVEGNAIYNSLLRHQGGLTVHIDSLAASMASVIAMAGAPTYIAENAVMIIHNPWTVSTGDADQLRKDAAALDVFKKSIRNAYTRKTGMSEKEISEMMDKETLINALDAVALGFADGIEEGLAAAACFKPEQLRARFDSFAKGMTEKPVTETPEIAEAPEAQAPVEATVISENAEVPVPEVVETPAAEEAPEAPAAEQPAEVVEPQAKVSAADSILAKYNEALAQRDTAISEASAYRAKFEALNSEVETLRSELAQDREDLDRLQRSLGLSAARVVPEIDQAANPSSIYDQWKNATGAEKTRIFRANRKALEAHAKTAAI